MRPRKIAFWSLLSLVGIVVLVLAWLWTADLGIFKPQLERWVSNATGREFRIEGRFDVDLATETVVIAEGIRLENADWAEPADMARIGRLEVRLELWSLFNGPVRISYVDFDDAELHVTRNKTGEFNWDVLEPRIAPRPAPDPDDAAGLPVRLGVVDIDAVRLVYDSPDRDRPLDLDIHFLDKASGSDDFFELVLDADIDDRAVSLRGRAGPVAALVAGRDVSYEFAGRLDTFSLSSSGQLDTFPLPSRPTITFEATGPDVDDLTRLLGIGEEGSGDIRLKGSLEPQPDGPLILDLGGNLGQTQVEATGRFSDLANLAQFDLELLASGPDLGRILRLAGIHSVREAPFMVDLDASRDGDRLEVSKAQMLFGEARFDATASLPRFPSLDDGMIDVAISGPDIERFRYLTGIPGSATGPFSADLELTVGDDGTENVDLRLATALGEVVASGKLGDAPGYHGSGFDVSARSDSLGGVLAAYGIAGLPATPVTIDGRVQYTADGIRLEGPVAIRYVDAAIEVDGLVALARGGRGTSLDIGIEGPDLAALLAATAGIDKIPARPYDLDARVTVGADGYRFERIAGTIGRSSLSATGRISNTAGLAGSRMEFSLEGPAFEEAVEAMGDVDVRPGPYALSGSATLRSDRLDVSKLVLDRERGNVALDFELGLPLSRRHADFMLDAGGSDVRALLGGVQAFEANELPFSIRFEGRLRDLRLDIERLRTTIGAAEAEASGAIDLSGEGRPTSLEVNGEVPSLAALGKVRGRALRDQRLSWRATINSSAGRIAVDDLDLDIGDSDIDGFVRYAHGDVPEIDIDIESESIVFAPLREPPEEAPYDPEPEFADGRLIPDLAVPFEALGRANAKVAVDIGEFTRDALYLRNLAISFDLRDGVLAIERAGFAARSGRIDIRGRLDPAGGEGEASVEIVARDFALGITETNSDLAMTGNLEVALDAAGNDLRTLLGNANGAILLTMHGGRIARNRVFTAIYGDTLREIVRTINPFSKSSPVTPLSCVIIPWRFEDGLVTSVPNSFMRTDKINIAARARINLKNENLKLNIKTTPRGGISFSTAELFNPYVQVVGTLAAPRLAVDEQGVLITGGAAAATGGLSIIATTVWDRLTRSGSPCRETEKQARKGLQALLPDWAPTATSDDASETDTVTNPDTTGATPEVTSGDTN